MVVVLGSRIFISTLAPYHIITRFLLLSLSLCLSLFSLIALILFILGSCMSSYIFAAGDNCISFWGVVVVVVVIVEQASLETD